MMYENFERAETIVKELRNLKETLHRLDAKTVRVQVWDLNRSEIIDEILTGDKSIYKFAIEANKFIEAIKEIIKKEIEDAEAILDKL